MSSSGSVSTKPKPVAASPAPEPPKPVFPRVDGSTATLPLAQAIWAAYTGSPEAGCPIEHNKTHAAYLNLINGLADLILVTEPSADELQTAAALAVDLEVVPVVAEAFVFLVNGDNPVDSLTQEQVRGIYTGAITNWSQAGGPDVPVTAYQRPENSGSQTGMLSLVMGGAEMATPPTEQIEMGMGDLVDAVADYRNSAGAIGYSYYYYVTDMYRKQNIKLLAIDGVEPSGANIADGSYPYGTAYYAVLRADTPEDHPARQLLAFKLSAEGQDAAARAGYVPPDMEKNPPTPGYPVAPLSLTDTYNIYDIRVNATYREGEPDMAGSRESYVTGVEIDGLYDKGVQKAVNRAIAAHMEALPKGDYKFSCNQLAGILSIDFFHHYEFDGGSYPEHYPLTLDLNTGDVLTFTGLFGGEDAAWEALRCAVYRHYASLFTWYGDNDSVDYEAEAAEILAAFSSADDIAFTLTGADITFYHNPDRQDNGGDWGLNTLYYPVLACRDFDGLRKYDNPIAPLQVTWFAGLAWWPGYSPDYRGGRFFAERTQPPRIPPGNDATERARIVYQYEAERAKQIDAETDSLFAATPEGMGRYDRFKLTIFDPDAPDRLRLVTVSEERISFTSSRTEWDATWQPLLLKWFQLPRYSVSTLYMVTLSAYCTEYGLPTPATLHESLVTYKADPVTGKEYRRIEDYFQAGYDAKAVVMGRMAEIRQRIEAPHLDDEALYLDDEALYRALMPTYTQDGFLFFYDSAGSLIAYTIPFSAFDMTRLDVPKW